MPRKGWKSISIPVEMVARIQRVIENRPDLGYRSVADFIIDAIRRRLEEISKSPLDR
ncbi:CopG family transcriptional regulator [Candidatus Bathyarchaeota archaeon]|nr:MAG: CopG family transcriptional regulator [Candidatus Bathyarchaeota archaeon]